MTSIWQQCGGEIHRLALPAGNVDIGAVRVSVKEKCRRHMRKGGEVSMHAALPCTAWCTFQNIKATKWPWFHKKLEAMRKRSRTRVKQYADLVKELKGEFPRLFKASYEWPRFCEGYDAAHCPEIRFIEKVLPHRADPDGCAYGVVSPKTRERIQKKWRVQATESSILRHLHRRCDGGHTHAKEWDSTTNSTGVYTRLFALALVRGHSSAPGASEVNVAGYYTTCPDGRRRLATAG